MGKDIIDKYSLLHFATGITAYFWNIPFKYWFALNVIFEALENSQTGMKIINTYFAGMWPGGKPSSDTLINSASDIFFSVLGWLVAYYVCNL